MATSLLSVREAARRADRTEETVRRWIWSRRLPARKVGNLLMVSAYDLDKILTARAPSRRSEPPTRPTLAAWVRDVDEWRARHGDASADSARDLVLEDRADRAGR